MVEPFAHGAVLGLHAASGKRPQAQSEMRPGQQRSDCVFPVRMPTIEPITYACFIFARRFCEKRAPAVHPLSRSYREWMVAYGCACVGHATGFVRGGGG